MKSTAFLILLLLISKPVLGQDVSLKPYEEYLNNIRTFIADFTEHSHHHDNVVTGRLYWERPKEETGKLRVIYKPPRKLDIMIRPDELIYQDLDDNQTHYGSPDSIPLSFLLKPTISFQETVMIRHYETHNQVTHLSLALRDNPEAGYITLIFEENPLQLRQWKIVQSNGTATTITIDNGQVNVPIPPSAFQFQNP